MHAERKINEMGVWIKLEPTASGDDFGDIDFSDQTGGICHHHYNTILFFQGTEDPNSFPDLQGMFIEPFSVTDVTFTSGVDFWVKTDTKPVTVVMEWV